MPDPICFRDKILSREDFKAQLTVVADIGGQFTGAESHAAFCLIEEHDETQRTGLAELETERDTVIRERDEARALQINYEHATKLERADTKRLDWREAHPHHGFGLYADGEWADGLGGSHKTYRSALDAAMQQEKP